MKSYQQVAVSGFILNSKQEVLLVKRSDSDDFLPGYWEMPGGGTDNGEHPIIALQREIKEEVGLDVEVGKPLTVDDYFMEKEDEKIHRVEIFFACLLKNNEPVVLSHEHSEYKWVSKDELPKVGMTDYTKKAIDSCFLHI